MSPAFHIRSRAELPVYRPINNLAVRVRVASQYGVDDPMALLEGTGIKTSDLDDPDSIITTLQYLKVAKRFTEMIPVPGINLELGMHIHLAVKGKLGMAAMCCSTVMEALELLIKYIDLAPSNFQYEIWTEGDVMYIRVRELVGFGGDNRHLLESELSSVYTILSHIFDNISIFNEMRFTFPAPAYADRYRETFKCPVVFGAPEHLIMLDADLLSRPLKLADPLARKVLEVECAQLSARLRDGISTADRVRHEITLGQHPYPTLKHLARHIGMSESTIRRRLSRENTSYKNILAQLRRTQALELIRSTDLSMEKIAVKLGYNDVSNFYHAFREWTGSTPGSFRKPNVA